MNWSLRVVEQIEILPKVASSRVCRHRIEETAARRPRSPLSSPGSGFLFDEFQRVRGFANAWQILDEFFGWFARQVRLELPAVR